MNSKQPLMNLAGNLLLLPPRLTMHLGYFAKEKTSCTSMYIYDFSNWYKLGDNFIPDALQLKPYHMIPHVILRERKR